MSLLIINRKLNIKIPGAISLSVLAIIFGYLCKSGHLPIDIYTLGDKFPIIELNFDFNYAFEFNKYILGTSLTVALIAILETMLSAKIADKTTNTSHNQRREIFGLGMANLASGIFGGIPATGALARVSLNIRSGAKSKASGIINGIIIGLISFLLLSQFKFMPMAAIAAILVDTAIRMTEARHFQKYRKHDRLSYLIAFIVSAVTVLEDPIFGIATGVIISFFFFVDNISRGHFELSINDENGLIRSMSGNKLRPIKEDGTVLLYTIRGTFIYINCEAHLSRFDSEYFSKYRAVIFRLREVYMIDLDGLEVFDKMIGLLKSKGVKVLISSASEPIKIKLRRLSKEYIYMENHGLVFDKTAFALESLGIINNKDR